MGRVPRGKQIMENLARNPPHAMSVPSPAPVLLKANTCLLEPEIRHHPSSHKRESSTTYFISYPQTDKGVSGLNKSSFVPTELRDTANARRYHNPQPQASHICSPELCSAPRSTCWLVCFQISMGMYHTSQEWSVALGSRVLISRDSAATHLPSAPRVQHPEILMPG